VCVCVCVRVCVRPHKSTSSISELTLAANSDRSFIVCPVVVEIKIFRVIFEQQHLRLFFRPNTRITHIFNYHFLREYYTIFAPVVIIGVSFQPLVCCREMSNGGRTKVARSRTEALYGAD